MNFYSIFFWILVGIILGCGLSFFVISEVAAYAAKKGNLFMRSNERSKWFPYNPKRWPEDENDL